MTTVPGTVLLNGFRQKNTRDMHDVCGVDLGQVREEGARQAWQPLLSRHEGVIKGHTHTC